MWAVRLFIHIHGKGCPTVLGCTIHIVKCTLGSRERVLHKARLRGHLGAAKLMQRSEAGLPGLDTNHCYKPNPSEKAD